MTMRSRSRKVRVLSILGFLLLAFSNISISEAYAGRNVGVGRFLKLSSTDFRAVDSSKADLVTLKSYYDLPLREDPLGTTLARMSFERLALNAPWKKTGDPNTEIAVIGSALDFIPEEFNATKADIVAAFYTYDGSQILLKPFIVDSAGFRMLSELSGTMVNLDEAVAAMVQEFQEGLLNRRLEPGESSVLDNPPSSPQAPDSLKASSRLEWKNAPSFNDASHRFTGALGRFVAGISLSALSAGTFFLYSEAYSRNVAGIASVYASGGAAIACIAASAVFAVQSIIDLSNLLRYSR